MARNIIYDPAEHMAVVCSSPATPVSGDPVRCGLLTGTALIDEQTDGETTVKFGSHVADQSVKAVNDSGNSAVALFDAIFYVDADTPKLSKKSSGYFYGFALETINSGSTSTIKVYHVPSPGAGTLGAGTVGATNLAADSVITAKIADDQVTSAKLSNTLATGFIPLALGAAREIVSNAIPNIAANGGILASDTTPTLGRINGATDKNWLVQWAASNSDAIEWNFAIPPDLDDTADLVVHLLVKAGGATDTPVMTVSYFEGVGDTNAGGNSAAITNAVTDKTVTILAANVATYPNSASISVLPGAHTTDTVDLLAAWVEYTRK